MAEKKTWRPVLDYDKEVADKIIWLCEHINELNLNEDAMKSNENVINVESDEKLNISETVSDYLSQTNSDADDSVVIKKYAVDVLQNFALHCKNANPNNYEELLSLSGSFDVFPDEHKSLFESYIKDMGIYYESCKKCISHLDNVGDGLFRTILKLVCHPKFKYELGYHLEKKTIVINSNVKYLCGKLNLDYNVFDSLLDNDDPEYNGIKIFSDFLYINDLTNRALCIGLKTDKSGVPVCPRCYYTLMAAICISHSYNLFEGYLKKRVDWGTTYYPFEWKPKDGLKKIPQHLFDLAVVLEENGLVRVNPELGMSIGKHGTDKSKLKSDKLYIDLYNAHCNFMRSYNSSEDISKLLPIDKRTFKFFKGTGLQDPLYVVDDYLKTCGYSCRKECCAALVAGYIHYLRVTNQMHIIDEDRNYYKNNEGAVLEEIGNIHSDVVVKANDKQTSKLFETDLGKTLMGYSDRIDGIEDLVTTLSGKYSDSVYGVIEAENGLREDEFIKDLISSVVNEGGVSTYKKTIFIPEPDKDGNFSVSRGDVFPTFLSTLNLKISPFGNSYKDSANRWCQSYMLPNVEILSMHNLANILTISISNHSNSISKDNVDGTFNYNPEKIEKGIGHYNLKKNGFYIVNGIREFLSLYKKSTDSKTKNLYNYMIEVLCTYNKQVKLFLCGTKEELKDLFALDSRFAQIYGLRLKFKPLSVDTLFETYKSNLEPRVYDMLYMERDFYSRFENYIADNRGLMAFKNYDLCSYLSAYSNQNSEDKVELPPDLYKRKTLEESLSTIIGLNSVKKKVYEFEAFSRYYSRATSLGMSLPKQNMHMIFTGNPGCGKTTIARIMAKMLYDIGILKENKLIEVDRKDLVGQYLGQTAPKTHEVVEKAMGGVLFIDEAYSLTAKNGGHGFDMYGQEAIATLIKDMEDRKGEFVVIFAGYKDEMKTFVDSNPGISSRIGYTFDFEDYTVPELVEIFKLKISLSGLRYDDACLENAFNLATYFKSRKNFGNGRFVDKLMQECLVRHAVRMGKFSEDDDVSGVFDLLTVEDMPSIEDLTGHQNEKSVEASELLNSLIGLEPIKKSMTDFENFVLFGEEAKKKGLKVPSQNLHMLFTGNPGCGKTTVARIVARILFDAGILHENKVIEVERKDLVGQFLGQTAPKTAEVIDRALGGVLFIDEAYSLTPENKYDMYGQEAISTLIKAMEDHKGEFVVILAGYKKEMKTFIDSNSGIASRIGYSFDFPDYSAEELQQIFMLKMKKSGFTVSKEAEEKVLKLTKFFAGVENIGNGRFVDKVVQETLLNHSRIKSDDISVISGGAVPSIQEMSECVYSVSGFINPDNIKVKKLRKTAIHELGHAISSMVLYEEPRIKNITINPEGRGSLGCTVFMVDADDYTHSKSELIKKMMVLLGGLANEEVVLGEFESGGTSDLGKCTAICNDMITRFGMSSLGFCQLNPNNQGVSAIILEESNKILNDCFADVKTILSEYKDKTLLAVDYLMEHRDMSEEKLREILFGKSSVKDDKGNIVINASKFNRD